MRERERIRVKVSFKLYNRLITDEERRWANKNIDTMAVKHFPNMNAEVALKRPILFSNWLSKDYLPVNREELRQFTTGYTEFLTSYSGSSESEVDLCMQLTLTKLTNCTPNPKLYKIAGGSALVKSGKTCNKHDSNSNLSFCYVDNFEFLDLTLASYETSSVCRVSCHYEVITF